ncbi:MAG TPA: sodium-translocating pyrophosphatase [Actinomycetota bacterium]|nr:sodium-translocating pyrophosphatase [Actinomycetota bacterium]
MVVLAQEGGPISAEFGAFEDAVLWIILGISVLALLVAYVLRRSVLAEPEGSEKMREIARAIQEGSRAYLNRQFRTVGMFLVVLTIGIFFLLPVPENAETSANAIRLGRSLAFIFGAGFSAVTGFAGMWLAVRGNVRVANAAKEVGLKRALIIAFRTGGVAGMFTVGLGLLGAALILLIYKQDATSVLVGFGFGGALLAMFMRVGGGIYTKAADVGADLVGKVEQGIPEDDPRNAATIADNVGDNVGDCAGMAADLFESYEVTLVASIILGAAAFADSPEGAIVGVMFPLFVRAIGVITSIIGIYAVMPRSDTEHGMRAINRGFFISAVLSAAAVYFVADVYVGDIRVFWAVVIGLLLASVIHVLTEHYTSTRRRPVQEVAESSQTGAATTILSGFSVGLESTVWAILVIAATIFSAFLLGNDVAERLYFISLTGMGMLTTVGVIVSMDTFGPVADNAQGIAEMSGEFEGRPAEVLQGLDAVGNSTKAITKGMAIATAVIAATSLFGSFEEALKEAGYEFLGVRVDQPEVLIGLLIGGSVSFLFAALAIRAVGRAAAQVVVEVRNQFRDHPGIMDGTEKPDYGRVVDICTRTSLRELLTPGLLAVLTPVVVGFAFAAEALGAFLAGVILTGQLLAVMLSNSGGAWDNAKKLVEEGLYGGKGSESHKATVIGDTVGDPFKDTAGPALNPLIKVMNLVALLIAPLVVSFADDVAVRVAIAGTGTVILGLAIWHSKRQRGPELIPSDPPSPEAATVTTETG